MNKKQINNLVVIENGRLDMYLLDDRLVWELGRPTKDSVPDIRLYSATISRKHGRFQNMDGIWFFVDNNGKNGTVYNEKHIETGLHGRVKPILLKNGDIFIFGGDKEAVINSKTVWARFSTHLYGEIWRVMDTRGTVRLHIDDGQTVTTLQQPPKGTVVEKENGLVIYMGDVTYLAGEVCVSC